MTPAPPLSGTHTTGQVAVLGERPRVAGYALAGAVIYIADDPASVRRTWHALGPEIAVVVLTSAAARALGSLATTVAWPLVAVMPE